MLRAIGLFLMGLGVVLGSWAMFAFQVSVPSEYGEPGTGILNIGLLHTQANFVAVAVSHFLGGAVLYAAGHISATVRDTSRAIVGE